MFVKQLQYCVGSVVDVRKADMLLEYVVGLNLVNFYCSQWTNEERLAEIETITKQEVDDVSSPKSTFQSRFSLLACSLCLVTFPHTSQCLSLPSVPCDSVTIPCASCA